ncbi:MAG: hypothetical protein WD651_01385 [Acidimicrobiia bacterium]
MQEVFHTGTLQECKYCGYLETGVGGGLVYEDVHWIVSSSPLVDVPGWLVGILRRHAEGFEGLTWAELTAFGPLVKRLTLAIKATTNVEKVYLFVMGEKVPHFHFVLLARHEGIPNEHRGPALFAHRDRYEDREAALRLAGSLSSYMTHGSI